MGCGASSEPKGKAREGNKKAEEPELNGKAKFLSCPVVSEVTNPDTKARWFLIAFAPLTHHGLIIAARNYATGELLVKDVPDSELAKEKEAQGITLSWNLFFKAVSTEISKANKAGAKWEMKPDGSMRIEIKISIAGAQANKKVDSYTCDLKAVLTTPENLFKYCMEPIATYYGKKRTDLLDRPDPIKEKQYGECEANSIVKASLIEKHQKTIAETKPRVLARRDEYHSLEKDAFLKHAKLVYAKRMLKEGTLHPSIAQPVALDELHEKGASKEVVVDAASKTVRLSFLFHHEEKLLNGSLKAIPFDVSSGSSTSLIASLETILATVGPLKQPLHKNEPIELPALPSADHLAGDEKTAWSQILAIEDPNFDQFNSAQLEQSTGGNGIYLLGLFVGYRYGLIGQNVLEENPTASNGSSGVLELDHFKRFLFVIQQIYHRSTIAEWKLDLPSNRWFHSAEGLCNTLHCLHHMLTAAGGVQLLSLRDPSELYTLWISALIHDLDHPGVNNPYLVLSRSFLATLYNDRSPIERHSLAVAVQLASVPETNIPMSELTRADMLQLVLTTDMSRHTEFFERFERRRTQISDWGRTKEDRLLACGILLKAADSFYVYGTGDLKREWIKRLREEFYRQGDLHRSEPALCLVPVQESMVRVKGEQSEDDAYLRNHDTFVTYVVSPVVVGLTSLLPELSVLASRCGELA